MKTQLRVPTFWGAWQFVFGLARHGSTIGFYLLCHTVELTMSTRLCLSWWWIWFLCFRFDALTELGAFERIKFLCFSVLRVTSGPRVKKAGRKGALNPPMVCSTDPAGVVVPVLVLLFVALWFTLRSDLFYVLPCVILFLCFSDILALRLPRLGKRELVLVLFVRLFDLSLFGFVCSLFLLVSGKGCSLWLWHSLNFSLTFFFHICISMYHLLILLWFSGQFYIAPGKMHIFARKYSQLVLYRSPAGLCGSVGCAVRLETRRTWDQEVAGSTPTKVGNILSWRLIMKYFLRSFSPFRWFKKGSCQFLAKECAQYWLTALRTKPAQ